MMKKQRLQLDAIGNWSEVKLDIVKAYAAEYSKILSARRNPEFHHVYIDGFAGAGRHISKNTGDFVPGSPLNAIAIRPPFKEYYLIDLDSDRTRMLRSLVGERSDVHILSGDCNRKLLENVFPMIKYEDYRRGLCVLDPYGLHLDWQVIETAGKMGSLEIFLNFPVMDMNRNVFWRNPEGVDPSDIERMNRFWGDESWREVAYRKQQTLFGPEDVRTDNETVAAAFRQKLQEVAGFRFVPEPLAMRNSQGATVYYLFFASRKPVAEKIVASIFKKYGGRS